MKKSILIVAAVALMAAGKLSAETTRSWAISEFATLLYADAPAALPYANADAPKGGRIVLSEFGTFDTLNYHVAKGDWPSSIGLLYDSLMEGTADEIDAYYGVIAESVEYPEDKSWAVFYIRPEAKYHDGSDIVAADFVNSLKAYKEKGRPWIKSLFEELSHSEAVDEKTFKVYFHTTDSMKPVLRAAGMSPLPVSYWKDKDITAASLEPPLTSGPYKVKKVDAGRTIIYERVKDYWARDLPLKAGLYNFDEIQYDYYRDETVMFEAFKSGDVDLRAESSAKRWVTEYDLEAVDQKRMLLEEFEIPKPRGLYGLYFNMALPKFQSDETREALVRLFDFETLQRTVLYGKYRRLRNYFNGAGYESNGIPEGRELALLEPFAEQLPKGILDTEFALPKTDGSGRDRVQRRKALELLKEAGWTQQGGKMLNAAGEQLSLEILTGWPEVEKFVSQYLNSLQRLGIDATLRVVETSQWRARVRDKDFDMVSVGKPFVVPPGSEMRSQYGSESAKERAGNTSSIVNPVIDSLIDEVVASQTEDDLKAAVHALDRVLLWNNYAIPLYYRPKSWVAWWDRFERPERAPRYELGATSTWWAKP